MGSSQDLMWSGLGWDGRSQDRLLNPLYRFSPDLALCGVSRMGKRSFECCSFAWGTAQESVTPQLKMKGQLLQS